jgi:hypothetical protein
LRKRETGWYRSACVPACREKAGGMRGAWGRFAVAGVAEAKAIIVGRRMSGLMRRGGLA